LPPPPIIQESDGSVLLLASEASLHGRLQYEVGGGKDDIGYWTDSSDTAGWSFKVDRPGKFTVVADIAAEASSKFEVIVGEQKLQGTAPATKDYTKFKRTNLSGTLEIASPGDVTLTVNPMRMAGSP